MLEAIVIFLAGLVCGIIAGRINFRQQRKKIEFYESYIHRRLHDSMPHATNDLRLRQVEKTHGESDYFRQGQS